MAELVKSQSMQDRKTKMVSFRLSPEEYLRFREACTNHGVRSVSELARTAMQSLVSMEGIPVSLQDQVKELRDRLAQLSGEVQRLVERKTL